jgi:hypothetical protein
MVSFRKPTFNDIIAKHLNPSMTAIYFRIVTDYLVRSPDFANNVL